MRRRRCRGGRRSICGVRSVSIDSHEEERREGGQLWHRMKNIDFCNR